MDKRALGIGIGVVAIGYALTRRPLPSWAEPGDRWEPSVPIWRCPNCGYQHGVEPAVCPACGKPTNGLSNGNGDGEGEQQSLLWNPDLHDSVEAYFEYVKSLGDNAETRSALKTLFGFTDEEIDIFFGLWMPGVTRCPVCNKGTELFWCRALSGFDSETSGGRRQYYVRWHRDGEDAPPYQMAFPHCSSCDILVAPDGRASARGTAYEYLYSVVFAQYDDQRGWVTVSPPLENYRTLSNMYEFVPAVEWKTGWRTRQASWWQRLSRV